VPAQIPEEEERAIADALRAGKKPNQIHEETGRGKSVIYRIMDSVGLKNSPTGPTVRTKKATETRRTWSRERRLGLNDKFLDMVNGRVDDNPSNQDLKTLATTYAIMIDKREILEPPMPLKIEDDGFISALESKSEEVFEDIDDNISLQVDCPKPQAMANSNLVDKDLSDQEL
jgi:hypothetical protein